MTELRYPAIEIQQQPNAPAMYLTAVPAAELLLWCDVPRTKEAYMAGYQRLLKESRAEEIEKYLRASPRNILPGAIIVATDKEYVSIEHHDKQDSRRVILRVSDDPRGFEQKLQELFGAFSTRLSVEELRSADIKVLTPDSDEIETDQDESEYPSSYIAALAQELHAAVQDWNSLSPDRQAVITDYINGASKPGLIIDGQHRVFGAKNVSGQDILLPVIVLHGLPHQEQVFQFYVLNNKAKPLTPTELRRNISTSLTKPEIEDLYKRFKEAKVDPEAAQWTYQLNNSTDSVFRTLIDFGFGTPGAIIKENVADQLVRAFMKMPRNRYAALIDPVGDAWSKTDDRLTMFFNLWRAVSQEYSSVWQDALTAARNSDQHQLFMKVALLTLQKFILDHFVTALPYRGPSAEPPFGSAQATTEMVHSTLQNLPSDFFSREWQEPQLDTTAGRQFLYDQMNKAWQNRGMNLGNLRLFRRPTGPGAVGE